jgi:hypothetical protein
MTQNDLQMLLSPMEMEYKEVTLKIQQLKETDFVDCEMYTQYRENLIGQQMAYQRCTTILLNEKFKIALKEAKEWTEAFEKYKP